MTPKITLCIFNGKIRIFEAIDDFNKCPTSKGVWCLYGYNDNSWKCLQVARSNDISTEIRSDIAYITALYPCQETPYTYINQFGRKVDDFKVYPTIRAQVYSKIGKDYENGELYFFIIEFLDEPLQREAEKFFAYSTQALYWRNGGSYKSERVVNVTELLSSINPTPTMVDAFHKMNTYIEEQDESH